MSSETFHSFLVKANEDTSLQKLCADSADVDALIEVAKKAGFEITAEDIENSKAEISEDDLAGVSGGSLFSSATSFLGKFLLNSSLKSTSYNGGTDRGGEMYRFTNSILMAIVSSINIIHRQTFFL